MTVSAPAIDISPPCVHLPLPFDDEGICQHTQLHHESDAVTRIDLPEIVGDPGEESHCMRRVDRPVPCLD